MDNSDLQIVKRPGGDALDKPASQLISEAILKGIDRYPVGRERRDECAKRRKEVRTALQRLYKVIERIDDAVRIKGDSEQFKHSEYKFHVRRAQWAVDRYKGLLFALRTLEGHDRLCRASLPASQASPQYPDARAKADDRVAEEYAMLSTDIEHHKAHAAKLVSQLEGSSFSFGQVLVWTLLWLTSPVTYVGGFMVSCAYRPIEQLTDAPRVDS
mmetsp:Transcript_37771/g.107903  ORF Transcript_37771/g.107903 Transcript_37771/m.107903 type:complete len:214 (+) Transcript_37771:45-686(+)|eukprot:CAMPEP_0168424580 /NCGR_PEP_ID=MMETSP0228-20121227/34893_1 /TAXON_ID=133427 /ORGANISM="Protoceratium reticulatum, Strain CCCM 535 (=CCMP 1889)" /LENGTH=213 /DNA_ID=CAMNT_0008438569 /DNA_START=42 /DNA_END=683 /DNA_ORIENTATION=+